MNGPTTDRHIDAAETYPLLAPVPRWRLALLVLALSTVMATAGIATIPFYTRGEPREALVVEAMVQGHGWALPRRNGELPRKPPFFHWVGAGTGVLLGRVDELTVRLPSVLASLAAALAVFIWAGASTGAAGGTLVALITVCSFEWMRAATVARVDMMYTALLTVTLLGLDRLLRGAPHPAVWRWLLYGATAAAVLTKGPIGLLLPALAALGVSWARPEAHLWQRVRPVRFAAVVALVAGTWFLLALREHGPEFLDIVVHENVHHLLDAEASGAGHAHGTLYLLGTAALGLLPWTLLLPLMVPAWRRYRHDPTVALSCIWVLTIFGVHALAAAKRSVYVLPAFPALALLVVVGIGTARTGTGPARRDRFLTWSARGYAALALALGTVILAVSSGLETPAWLWELLSPRDQAGTSAVLAAVRARSLLCVAVATVTCGAAVMLIRAARAGSWDRLIVTVAVLAALMTVTFNAAIHPALALQRSLKTFMESVSAIVPPEDPLHFLGSVDPGAVFYARRPIAHLPLRTTRLPGLYLLVWERDWPRVQANVLPLEPLKVSAVTLPRKGHLLLVRTRTTAGARGTATGTPRLPTPGLPTPQPNAPATNAPSALRATPRGR
jgi:4-amino-4-deoxy-L-arabinose transferase-like glycosyltransferase